MCSSDLYPYVPVRWLAAAQATFGYDLIAAALDDLRRQTAYDPDRVLQRSEVIEAIIAERRRLVDARKAADGLKLRDVLTIRH